MKKAIALIVALFFTAGAYAQIESHVRWAYAAKKSSPTEVTVFLKATIDPAWHIYSQHVNDGGPIKTSFTFNKSKDYTLVGNTTEPKAISHYDNNFKMDVAYFEKEVIFQQKIKLKSPKVAAIKGTLEFMTCNDAKCLPPDDVNFTIPIGK